ncbi:FecR domain-containing protein [Spirosoma sp.]|uniref:FecR family protein n=1 Tax=Spirosoma sp. TaxID=1899569 RepID=UPI00260FB89E|nr:FecR domain-containing protein [Spirosoma sp.]MCX6216676.1 FecR domain-containing protein [Spirosoma sp.]
MADQQPIDDALLGKFLAGETDPAESARVRQWLSTRTSGPTEPNPDDFDRFEHIWDAAEPDPTEVDTDAAWRSVQQKMRVSDRNPARRQGPIVKPLPVLQPERRVPGMISLWRMAAMLTLLAGMGWLIVKLRFYGQHHPAEGMVALTANEQPISKTLPDGTHIFLNRHSTLRYPTAFAEERRDVTLTGEAFFEVTPDASRPFHIAARQSVVQVLGTSFTVRAYDANVSVTVRTGKVRFSSGRKAVLLTKNQKATFEASVDTMRRLPASPNAFAYKTGVLVFDKEPLRDVVQAINQYYNADVQLANAKLGNCLLTTRFDKMPLATVLNVTAETLGLQVRYVGRQVILEGAGCQ